MNRTTPHNELEASSCREGPVDGFSLSWWVALGLLLLNDHCLKDAGLVSPWATGKISDFAGLFVAPVVLAAVIRVRSWYTKLACLLAVGVVFTAVKLAPTLARELTSWLTAMGIPSRLWSDPTDLVALCILPLTWRELTRHARCTRRGFLAWAVARKRGTLQLGVVLGGLACVATSYRGDPWASLALVNATSHDLTVRIYRAEGPLECEEGSDPSTLENGELGFEYERCFTLRPTEGVSLDPATGLREGCDCVAVAMQGLPATAISWSDSRVEHIHPARREAQDQAIYVHDLGQTLYLDPGPIGHLWELPSGLVEGPPDANEVCETW